MSSKIQIFLQSKINVFEEKYFLYIVDFNGGQRVEAPNCSFSAASNGSTRSQPMNKSLILAKKNNFDTFYPQMLVLH